MALRSGNHNRSPGYQSKTLSGKTVGYSANETGGTVSKGNIVASGGDEFIIGDYKYHVFTSTDYLSVSDAPSLSSIQFTIIAGGGSPPTYSNNGGGGAGGFVNGTSAQGQIGIGSHLISVGGAGSPSYIFDPSAIPGPGSRAPNNANELTTEAIRGQYSLQYPPSPGGSGNGGGGLYGNDLSQGIAGQGNPGGSGQNSPTARCGGGGGGAGGAGIPGSYGGPTSVPADVGFGGIGKAAFNGDQFPTSYGTPGPNPGRWFAGGGGGDSSPANPSGGYGGGGSHPSGSINPGVSPYANGAVNTGGGAWNSGTGGSGIVIVRYTVSANYNYPVLNPA